MTEKINIPAKIPTQLFPSGHHWNIYQHVSAAGVSLEQVLHHAYWAHVAAQLKVLDVINVIAADNAFDASLRVINAGKGTFALRVIALVGDPLTDTAAPDAGELSVNFAPKHGWRVIDSITKEVIAKDLASKEEAEHARANLLNARKAA